MHVEVQYEACELIKDLMNYEIKEDLIQRLVALLRPTAADIEKIPKTFSGTFMQLGYSYTTLESKN